MILWTSRRISSKGLVYLIEAFGGVDPSFERVLLVNPSFYIILWFKTGISASEFVLLRVAFAEKPTSRMGHEGFVILIIVSC